MVTQPVMHWGPSCTSGGALMSVWARRTYVPLTEAVMAELEVQHSGTSRKPGEALMSARARRPIPDTSPARKLVASTARRPGTEAKPRTS